MGEQKVCWKLERELIFQQRRCLLGLLLGLLIDFTELKHRTSPQALVITAWSSFLEMNGDSEDEYLYFKI